MTEHHHTRDKLTNVLPERLKAARNAAELTLMGMAQRAGLSSPTMVADYESGRRTPGAKHLAAMAHELGVSTDWLLGLSDSVQGAAF